MEPVSEPFKSEGNVMLALKRITGGGAYKDIYVTNK